MEATIQYINVYDNGSIEMVVICNNCNHTNYHNITHSSKLGKRSCDNFGKLKNPNFVCYADYKLYK